jgi:hypothetical protein
MSFFEAEIIREEIENIANLGSQIMETLQGFSMLSKDKMREKINIMQEQLDKTMIFCFRLNLSDDKDAKKTMEELRICAKLLGKENIMDALKEVQLVINDMKEQLDQ